MDVLDQVKALCKQHGVPFGTIKKNLAGVQGGQPARVELGKIYRKMPKALIPSVPGALTLYVSKGRSTIGNQVSPFNVHIPESVSPGTVEGTAGSTLLAQDVPLELWWQAAKAHAAEVEGPVATDKYFQRRANIYNKAVPKRRYLTANQVVAGSVFGDNRTLVAYVPSRVHYCRAYAEVVQRSPAFLFMVSLVRDLGIPLLLLGPDAFPVTGSWRDCYLDPSKPFGHERVLACMLTVPDPTQWPWQSPQ